MHKMVIQSGRGVSYVHSTYLLFFGQKHWIGFYSRSCESGRLDVLSYLLEAHSAVHIKHRTVSLSTVLNISCAVEMGPI